MALVTAFSIMAAATVVNTAVSIRQADRTEEAQKKAEAADRAIAGEEAARARRSVMAEAQVERARLENQAAEGGLASSSGAIAGGQSITAQAADNISEIGFQQGAASVRANKARDVRQAQMPTIGESLLSAGSNIAMSYGANKMGVELGKE